MDCVTVGQSHAVRFLKLPSHETVSGCKKIIFAKMSHCFSSWQYFCSCLISELLQKSLFFFFFFLNDTDNIKHSPSISLPEEKTPGKEKIKSITRLTSKFRCWSWCASRPTGLVGFRDEPESCDNSNQAQDHTTNTHCRLHSLLVCVYLHLCRKKNTHTDRYRKSFLLMCFWELALVLQPAVGDV